MQRSPIEWTHFTSNPLRYRDKDGNVVHACIHASTGCKLCYSEKMAGRWGRSGKAFTAPNMADLTPFLDEKELHSILTYKPAAGQMCFLGDMTDIFGEWVSDALLDQLFAVLAIRHGVTFQILTKRADRMREYFTLPAERHSRWKEAAKNLSFPQNDPWDFYDAVRFRPFPLPNVWLGVSVENQEYADKRIPLLLQTPAAKRFVSYEPALGPVDFTSINLFEHVQAELHPIHADLNRIDGHYPKHMPLNSLNGWNPGGDRLGHLDWIIVGGESGQGARSFDVSWAWSVIEQCRNSNVACFVKQMGSNVVDRNDAGFDGNDGIGWPAHLMEENRIEDLDTGYQGAPVRLRLRDAKGGDINEWPPDLRVREFPTDPSAAVSA